MRVFQCGGEYSKDDEMWLIWLAKADQTISIACTSPCLEFERIRRQKYLSSMQIAYGKQYKWIYQYDSGTSHGKDLSKHSTTIHPRRSPRLPSTQQRCHAQSNTKEESSHPPRRMPTYTSLHYERLYPRNRGKPTLREPTLTV